MPKRNEHLEQLLLGSGIRILVAHSEYWRLAIVALFLGLLYYMSSTLV